MTPSMLQLPCQNLAIDIVMGSARVEADKDRQGFFGFSCSHLWRWVGKKSLIAFHEFLWPREILCKETYIDSVVVKINRIMEYFLSEKLHLLQDCVVRKDLQADHLLEGFYFERFLEGGQEELRPDWSERRWNQANLEITFLDKTTKNILSLLIIWDLLWIFVHFPGE